MPASPTVRPLVESDLSATAGVPASGARVYSAIAGYLATTGGLEQLQDAVAAFLVGGTYDDAGGKYTLPTGSSGSSSVMSVSIPASDLVDFSAGASEATKLAAINANSAKWAQVALANPGKRIVLDPSKAWPMQFDLNEILGTYKAADGTTDVAFTPGLDYILEGRVRTVTGTRTSASDTTTGRIQQKPAIGITRKATASVITPTNLRTVQLGPNLPNTGSLFTVVCSGFDVTAGMAQFAAYGMGHLCSNNGYPWQTRAGYSFIGKATMFPIAGVMLTVGSYSMAAVQSAASNPSIVSMERRTVVGATSGATALIAGGDMGAGAGQLVANSVSGDFTSGETLKDQATGATIGTFSSFTVLMAGLLDDTYTTTPQFRLVGSTSRVDVSRVVFETDTDPDLFVAEWNRPDSCILTGCPNVNLDGCLIKSSYRAGIIPRSCWNVTGKVRADFLPNHAIETADAREGAYGYVVRLWGATTNFGIGVEASWARHCVTTNGIGATWNLNSRTGSTAGSADLCTNFWNHGPGARGGFVYGKGTNMLATGWDCHEGARDLLFLNPVVFNPNSAGRSTTAGDGCQIRGFNVTVLNPYFSGVRVGVNDLAGPLDSDGLAYTNRVIGGVCEKVQLYGWAQSEDSYSDAQGRWEVHGTRFTADTRVAKTTYQQAGLLIRKGNVDTSNVRLEYFNDRMVRHTSYVDGSGIGSSAAGRVVHKNLTMKWAPGGASRAYSTEATYAGVWMYDTEAKNNPDSGTQLPLYWILNSGGTTPHYYRNLIADPLSSLSTAPALFSDTSGASAPTPVRVLDLGETTGGGGGSTVVYAASIDSDFTVASTQTTAAEVTGLTVTGLPVGQYLVDAELLYQVAAGGTVGSLRTGLAPAGTSPVTATVTNLAHDQFNNTTARNFVPLTALAAVGTAMTQASNGSGVSPGTFAATLLMRITGKVTVTATGGLSVVANMSSGADRAGTIKAGSSLLLTKIG